MVSVSHTHPPTHTLFGGLFLLLKEAEENNLLLFQLSSVVSLPSAVVVRNVSAVSAAAHWFVQDSRGLEPTPKQTDGDNPPLSHCEECSLCLCACLFKNVSLSFFRASLLSFLPPKTPASLPPEHTHIQLSCWIIVT